MALYNRATVLARLGQLAGAIADLDRAVVLDPAYVKAYTQRGLLHSKLEHVDQSLADYDTAIRLQKSQAAK